MVHHSTNIYSPPDTVVQLNQAARNLEKYSPSRIHSARVELGKLSNVIGELFESGFKRKRRESQLRVLTNALSQFSANTTELALIELIDNHLRKVAETCELKWIRLVTVSNSSLTPAVHAAAGFGDQLLPEAIDLPSTIPPHEIVDLYISLIGLNNESSAIGKSRQPVGSRFFVWQYQDAARIDEDSRRTVEQYCSEALLAILRVSESLIKVRENKQLQMSAAKAAYCLTVPAQRLSDVATYLQERASDEPGQTLDGLGPELATLEASCDELESTLANFRVPFERLDEMSLDHIVLEPTIDHLVKRMQERAKSSGVELVIDIDLSLIHI